MAPLDAGLRRGTLPVVYDLAEITTRMAGRRRTGIETVDRLVMLIVASFMVWFGRRSTPSLAGSGMSGL